MSSERRKQYPFDEFEPKWQKLWDDTKAFRTPGPGDADFDATKPKYYVLDMFPYPSGQGLHVGHPEGYTATDIVGRFKKMRGFNVLHPMGWDAFGLPAEQYAIKTGTHPRVTTEANVANFTKQLKSLGFAYDWDREVNTTDPGYFKWTQWIFLQLYHSYFDEKTNKARPIAELEAQGLKREEIDARRLAYVSEAPVNWCPQLGTVLANEEVIDGKSEVGGFPVERRPMRQWMLRITAYAERLAHDLVGLDWPDSIKMLQTDWIGRSEGAYVDFEIAHSHSVIVDHAWSPAGSQIVPAAKPVPLRLDPIRVFTTRPDTLFGAEYLVLAPEHPLIRQMLGANVIPAQWPDGTPESWKGDNSNVAGPYNAVIAYRTQTYAKKERDRLQEGGKTKSGVFTGVYARNPVCPTKLIPIWVADYVLIGYGTGAIMAVPAHDGRDFEFAQKFNLPITQVVEPASGEIWQGYTGDGTAINSGFIDGLPTSEAKQRITQWLEEKNLGKGTVNYKLRDWLFSRQRYWGEPFPVLWEDGHHRAVPESELPVVPPDLDDFKPTGTPEPPLSKATAWVKYSDKATRELNTMPQWAGSCWYYLRYCDPKNAQRFISKEADAYWMGANKQPGGVDLYVGGTEHAVLHLLYARFWHKVLFDLGHVSTPEPFQRLVNQGLILGEDGAKMSKSRGNVVNPDDVVAEYGADSLRLYEMFMGPLEQVKPWSMKGVEGVYRFLARVWRLVMESNQEGEWVLSPQLQDVPVDKKLSKVIHETIKKVGEDIEKLSFNTSISQMMVLTNAFTQAEVRPAGGVMLLLRVLNPFAPHITEEVAARIGDAFPELKAGGLLAHQPWPQFDATALIEDEAEVVLQVNGKLRDRISVVINAPKAEMEKLALASAKVQEFTAGLTIRKVVVVPNKLVNIVAN